MNKLILKLKLNKEKQVLLDLIDLNILNFKIKNLKYFIYLNNYNIEEMYFIGMKIKANKEKIKIYNKKDTSILFYLLYCPYIYYILYF